MARVYPLLGLLPLLGLGELAAHQYFASRAPDPHDYAALGRALLKLKRPGVPIVVAPSWAEPLVRAAAPAAFPIGELTRADDSGFAELLEVSLLGEEAPELAGLTRKTPRVLGRFVVTEIENPKAAPPSFDFVTAVDLGQVEVYLDNAGVRSPCPLVSVAGPTTGGLHGHAAYPERRLQCSTDRFVTVSLTEDADYRPHRCILTRLPSRGRLVLRFTGVPRAARLLAFGGFAYFLERDAVEPQVSLTVSDERAELGARRFAGAGGWARWPLGGTE
ncbi:MAG: hypothetical protein EOO73_35780, partial [Myxococcales bacterium]